MKFRTVISLGILSFVAGALLAEVIPPKPGIARYADHSVFQIYGLESNLLVNGQFLSTADALSFSDQGGLVASGGAVRLITLEGDVLGEYNSSESAPVLNIDNDLTTAIAWLPSTAKVIRWNGQAFAATEIDSAALPGQVTSIQVSGTASAKLLAKDAQGNVFAVSLSLETGQVGSVNLLPGVKGAAVQQYSFVVSHDANGLHVTGANGSERTLPLAAPGLTFERMSSDWVHLASPETGEDWALHLTPAVLHLSQLPKPESMRRLAARPREPKEKTQ